MHILLFALLLLAGPAMAQDTARPAEPEPEQATRLEVDEEAGAVRIIINGQEQARIDETGLHVREEINYGATLTDYGEAGFDEHAARSRGQGHAE